MTQVDVLQNDLTRIIEIYQSRHNNEIKPKTISTLKDHLKINQDIRKTITEYTWRATYKKSGKLIKELISIVDEYYDLTQQNIKFNFNKLLLQQDDANNVEYTNNLSLYDNSYLLPKTVDYILKTIDYKDTKTLLTNIPLFKYDYQSMIEYISKYKDDKRVKTILQDMTTFTYEELTSIEFLETEVNSLLWNFPVIYYERRLNTLISTEDKTRYDIACFISYIKNPFSVKQQYRNELIAFHDAIINCEPIYSVTKNAKAKDHFMTSHFQFNMVTKDTNEFIQECFTTNSMYDYNNNGMSERSNGFYRRFSIDIDCHVFDARVFCKDMQCLNHYIYTEDPFTQCVAYWSIDYNFKERDDEQQMDIETLLQLIHVHIPSSANHVIAHWYNPNLKDKELTIHIYHPGFYFSTISLQEFSKLLPMITIGYQYNDFESGNSIKLNESYIDPSPYKKGHQMFRLPFSNKYKKDNDGNLIIARPTIDRLQNTNIKSKEELVQFFSNCSIHPSQTDEFDDFFDKYMLVINKPTKRKLNDKDKQLKQDCFKKVDTSEMVYSSINNCCFNDVDNEMYNDSFARKMTAFDNFVVQKMFDRCNETNSDYNSNLEMRRKMTMNLFAMGLEQDTIVDIVSRQIIKHATRPDEENKYPLSIITWIQSTFGNENGTVDLYWDDSIFSNKHGQPLLFTFDVTVKELLRNEVLSTKQLKFLLKHLFIDINNAIIYKQDKDNGSISTPISIGSVDEKIFKYEIKCYEDGEVYETTLSNAIIKLKCCKLYSSYTIGIVDPQDTKNKNVYDVCNYNYYSSNVKTHADRPPAINFLLHSMLDNDESGFEQSELDERVNLFENYIAFKLQNPGVHIPVGIVVQTSPGVGKSTYAKILSLMTSHAFDNADLSKELQQFNAAYLDKTILFYNEVPKTANMPNTIKKLITEASKVIEIKGGDVLIVPNNSLKIFFTNEIDLNFIENDDRRFIVFKGTKEQKDVIDMFYQDGFIYADTKKGIINPVLIETYFKYLLQLHIPQDFIPSRIPNTKAINENKIDMMNRRSSEDGVLISFLNEMMSRIKTPTMAKTNKKCITTKHIVTILNILQQQSNGYEKDDDLKWFNDSDSLKELVDMYSEDYPTNNTNNITWSEHKINPILLNNRYKFNYKKRFYLTSLVIADEFIEELYPQRPDIFIWSH